MKLKFLRVMPLVIPFLISNLSTMALAGSEIATPTDPQNLIFIRNSAIGGDIRHEIMDSLKNTPYFDENKNEVYEVLTWTTTQGEGVIVAVRAGTGKSAGCAIYEKFGGSGFEFVTGQPYCSFSNPSGKFYSKSLSIKFIGKLRQSSDSPAFDNWFELFYDKRNGIFCYPESRSQKFKCSGASS